MLSGVGVPITISGWSFLGRRDGVNWVAAAAAAALHGDLECWLRRLWSKSSSPARSGVGGMLETLPTRENDEVVEQLQDARRRLVDGEHDGAPGAGDVAHLLDHAVRARGVQTGRRLVEEQQRGAMDDVHADRHTPPLAAGHAPGPLVADVRVPGRREAELVDEGVDAAALVGGGDGGAEAEVGGEHEGLADGEHGEEAVVLHDVGGAALDEAGAHLHAVERDAAAEAGGDAAGERVEERRLAGAAGAHHGGDAALGGVPGSCRSGCGGGRGRRRGRGPTRRRSRGGGGGPGGPCGR
ncbi:Os07g0191625 [Oryza sativa Japonica Group]|uniref:Os07g0191625 protein n=1 Tax=Oryza sativa subsp. japonica TaxID=39947 RepID=A0A0P0X360_ORYSJ|nr:hypothetical protein EE612_037613 [Oryza sativa]BAT00431.1 Os07g0191625 [Oryza sativa Japonica Group]